MYKFKGGDQLFNGYCEQREDTKDLWLSALRRFTDQNVMDIETTQWITGFGRPYDDYAYWLGLENLHSFTAQVRSEIEFSIWLIVASI